MKKIVRYKVGDAIPSDAVFIKKERLVSGRDEPDHPLLNGALRHETYFYYEVKIKPEKNAHFFKTDGHACILYNRALLVDVNSLSGWYIEQGFNDIGDINTEYVRDIIKRNTKQ